MSNDAEIEAIKQALRDHLREIEAAHGEALAAQTLLVGLMLALKRRGFDEALFEEVFDYAAQVGMVGGENIGPQAARVVGVVDQLRETVIGKKPPKHEIE